MAKEEILEFPGTVVELLPNATFRVKLENEHEFFRLKLTSKGLLPKYTNEAIFSFFDKTLNSKSAPKKGFKKKGSNHFRLAEIIDPVDDEIRSS